MKILITYFLLLTAALLTTVAFSENDETSKARKERNYDVFPLGDLGGTSSGGNSINNRGWIAGISNLDGDEIGHATLWRDGLVFDLGTLGGSNSNVAWPVKNNRGIIAGISETGEADPLGQLWSCRFFFPSTTGEKCVGFVWKDDEMKPLPTLGGHNGFATGVNKKGEIAGWAENLIEDDTCNEPQELQFRPVIWGPDEDQIRELPRFEDDRVGAATALNDRGQVVGISGICANAVGGLSAIHPVLWENGDVINMGDIGGEAWNTPMAINKHGEVVGFANVTPGEGFNAHAFYWTKHQDMEDLGALDDHTTSQALGINKKGQIVGMSCGADCRAFIYEDGEMKDLNLLAPDFDGHLVYANDINDHGEITGGAFIESTGETVTFLAVPKKKNKNSGADASAGTQSERNQAKVVVLPEHVEQMLMRRIGLAGIPWLERLEK